TLRSKQNHLRWNKSELPLLKDKDGRKSKSYLCKNRSCSLPQKFVAGLLKLIHDNMDSSQQIKQNDNRKQQCRCIELQASHRRSKRRKNCCRRNQHGKSFNLSIWRRHDASQI